MNLPEYFDPTGVWTDGTNIYYSYTYPTTVHLVLDVATSTWSPKTWNGLTRFSGGSIWTDGTDTYYSSYRNYVLDKATSTWNDIDWGFEITNGRNIWTDGYNTYYSDGGEQYILEKNYTL